MAEFTKFSKIIHFSCDFTICFSYGMPDFSGSAVTKIAKSNHFLPNPKFLKANIGLAINCHQNSNLEQREYEKLVLMSYNFRGTFRYFGKYSSFKFTL